jgi:ketosteroid isomerase-like protein
MKTRLTFLVLLIISFSCGTNNKPLSDAHKEKIKGEIKEVVDTFIKGCEEANADMVMESFLDSPEFVDLTNGMTFGYKEIIAMKPNFNAILNQKCTIINEKFAFLDKSTVLYTAETKWSTNYKDGHSSITDPQAFLVIFKKIDNKWKVIYLVDSNVEKNVPGESAKGLNQVELLKKFIGNWEIPSGKDTYEYVTIKSLQEGNGLSIYAKWTTNGKMFLEGTGFWAYDAEINKIDISIATSMGDVIHDQGVFTSPNMMEYVNVNNAPAYKGISKSMLEFISPDELKGTTLKDNKPEIVTWKRIK